MEKKKWTPPRVHFVKFAADEYISTCGPVSKVNGLKCNVTIPGWPDTSIGNGYPGYIMLEADDSPNSADYNSANSIQAHLSAHSSTGETSGTNYWEHIFSDNTVYTSDQLLGVGAYDGLPGAFTSCMDDTVHNNVDVSHVRNGWYAAGDLSQGPSATSPWQAVTIWFDTTIHAMFNHTTFATAKS